MALAIRRDKKKIGKKKSLFVSFACDSFVLPVSRFLCSPCPTYRQTRRTDVRSHIRTRISHLVPVAKNRTRFASRFHRSSRERARTTLQRTHPRTNSPPNVSWNTKIQNEKKTKKQTQDLTSRFKINEKRNETTATMIIKRKRKKKENSYRT